MSLKMAHFIRRNRVKLGLLTLTSNISESCSNAKTIDMLFQSPDMRLSDFRRTEF